MIQDLIWSNFNNVIEAFQRDRGLIDLDNISKLVKAGFGSERDVSVDHVLSLAELKSKQIPRSYD